LLPSLVYKFGRVGLQVKLRPPLPVDFPGVRYNARSNQHRQERSMPSSQPTGSTSNKQPTYAIAKPLAGQRALVTGASSGIGKGIAIALGLAGADVVVNYRSRKEGAEEAVSQINSFGVRAYSHQCDVAREDEVQAMFRRMFDQFGTVDILVNNSGHQMDAPFDQMTLEQWNGVLSTNLTGQFLCAREAVREFKRRGVRADVSRAAGKIICISSVHEIIPWAGHVNYAASKGGVMLFMKSLAQEVAAQKIRVNSITPGAIRTPINTAAWDTPEAYNDLLKLIPVKRIGEVEDVGHAAVWLASDESDYVHGVSLVIDGGMTLYPGFESGG
jgi:glucose 1-dehydrogenase